MRAAAGLGILVVAMGVVLWRYGPWTPPVFVEYPMLAGDIPAALAIAPDGSVWFTIENSNAIGVLRRGALERLPKGRENLEPLGLGVSLSGDVWFTDAITESIGRLGSDGTLTAFPLPTGITQFGRLAVAPDGDVWFTDSWSNAIVRLHDGQFTPYEPSTPNANPFGVAVDSRGTVWATLQTANRLMRITPDGQTTELDLPTRSAGPTDVAVDRTGAVWFVELRAGKIGRYAAGRMDEFAVPSRQAGLTSLAVAPDGSVWSTALREHKLVRLRGGEFTDFHLSRPSARPFGVAADDAGNIWYTDLAGWLGSLHADEAQAAGLNPRTLLPRVWLAR
jgi:virginiamycin B lyase